jgi:methionine synthase II (cobalamin-independent)
MTEVSLTHVGSLPHKDLSSALDYTFKFDLPVLFTLPNLDENQYMGKDIVTQLGIGDYSLEHQISLNKNYMNSKERLKPPFLHEFLNELKSKGRTGFKYQLIGPVTFFHLLGKTEFSIEEVGEFLAKKYIDLLKLLGPFGLELFILDEPVLGNSTEGQREYLKTFLIELYKKTNINTGLHVCSKLEPNALMKFEGFVLNLDYSLYSSDEIASIKETNFIGLSHGGLSDCHKAEDFNKNLADKVFLSPSCGLAFHQIDEIDNIFNNLSQTKGLFLASIRELK